MESLGLKQHVTQPTHVDGHILDLIITRLSDNIIKDPPHVDRYISDHASILCNLLEPKPAITVKKITYRKIKSVNLESLRSDLAASALCNDLSNNQGTDLDDLVRNYNNTLSKAIDCHAPLKTKKMVIRPAVPWYNDDINIAKRLRRKAERKWRRTKSVTDLIDFKKKNHVTYIMNRLSACYLIVSK